MDGCGVQRRLEENKPQCGGFFSSKSLVHAESVLHTTVVVSTSTTLCVSVYVDGMLCFIAFGCVSMLK